MAIYKYSFKTQSGLHVNFKASNIQYARQRLANIHNIPQKDLKLIKRIKITR